MVDIPGSSFKGSPSRSLSVYIGFKVIPSAVVHRNASGSFPLSCFFANSFHFGSSGFSEADDELLADASSSLVLERIFGLLGNIVDDLEYPNYGALT